VPNVKHGLGHLKFLYQDTCKRVTDSVVTGAGARLRDDKVNQRPLTLFVQ
jgi:hypothetical protein